MTSLHCHRHVSFHALDAVENRSIHKMKAHGFEPVGS